MSQQVLPQRLTRLTLGAAAIGQSYGIANPKETMSDLAAQSILDRCWAAGIRSIDTAAAYGNAEDRIGRWTQRRALSPVIISKSTPLGDVPDDQIAVTLNKSLGTSRSKLRVSAVDGYLLHSPSDWRRQSVRSALKAAKDQGLVHAVGVSAYDAEDVLELLLIDRFDILQLPFSIFDRRAETIGLLDRTRDLGITVFARSAFLQGLLFLDPSQLSPAFRAAASQLEKLRCLAAESGCDLTTIALNASANADGIASVVVGFYSAMQVEQAANAIATSVEDSVIEEAFEIAGALPESLRDPRRWPRT